MPTSAFANQIVCTLFAGIRKAVQSEWRGTWDDFVADVLPELVSRKAREKKRCVGFVLAPVDGERNDANVGAHTALAIDVDALPDADLGALLKRASEYRAAVYETPSSTDEAPRVRVLVALRKPLQPDAVPAARLAFAEALGLDPEACGTAGARAASQVMFAGRLRGTRERGLWAFDGAPFKAPASDRKRPRAQPLDTRRHAPASGRERHAHVREGAFPFDSPPDLSALAKHVPPAGVDGDRHLLCRAVGGWLARRGYSPEAIEEAVREQIPASDPAERAAQAKDAAERVRRGEEAPGWEALSSWAERYAKGPSTLRRLERACRDPREPEGFGAGAEGTGEVWSEWWAGVWPQWEARAERWRARRTVTDGEATIPAGGDVDATGTHLHPLSGWPWIVQHGESHWLHALDARTYQDRQYRGGELRSAVAGELAGLISEDDRKPAMLQDSWVRVARTLESTYVARAHTYDPQTRTLTLAALRWMPAERARRHAPIDRWLRALFGSGYDAAAQWLASLVALDRPAPCLYMPGPKELGKSLLADGLARIWGRPAPVGMREAIDSFNEATASCPLVFTDEGFPPDLDFNAFREMITQHTRRVNEKYRAKFSVEGCGRYLLAANNEDVLRYQRTGVLTQADLEAIADRLLVVPCCEDARTVLREHSHRTLVAWAQGEIAEHVLWLAQTVELEPMGRMAAKPGGGERILSGVVAARNADVLVRIREMLGAGSLGVQSGVYVPKREPEAVYVNVPRLTATLEGRTALSSVRECCDSFALRAGSEQHKIGKDNFKWRVLSRLRLDEAFAKLD
jgi:hypothetical protein